MTSTSTSFSLQRLPCFYRPLLLVAGALVLLCTFWFTSRYPSLFKKSALAGLAIPSMAYSSEVVSASETAPAWQRVLLSAVNWLDGMKVGMAFGVLFGALLHTWLRTYPLKIGRNLWLNSIKGALVGVPMGVCANCAVPAACGVTRGHGRVEVALGFLFSSPNFNPVVVAMTFTALPLAMCLTKYALLLAVILLVVPGVIGWLERKGPLQMLTVGEEGASCAVPLNGECNERFTAVARQVLRDYAGNAWMLLKPTITLMLLGSLLSAALLTWIPWKELLSSMTPGRAALASLISVIMPVPIALDVMFAAQLQGQGVPSGYVMLFAMTLGTYSIIPTVYLWREVSRRLAVALFLFFFLTGWIMALAF